MGAGNRVDVLREDYRELYRHLQERMSTGDLSAGPADTFAQHRQSGVWTLDRSRLHRSIMDEAKAATAGLPRDGKAVLLTSGPPGAGKGTSLGLLSDRQGDQTDLGRALADAHGVDPSAYVKLDPDQFKEAIIRHGGAPVLTAQARELPGGRQLAPSELAALVHRESAHLQDAFELWAREQGFNLIYDGTMKNLPKTEALLGDLAREGYGQRVVLSVEVPMATSLEQNAHRWQIGRIEFDAGKDAYGGRMAPEPLIRALYPEGAKSAYSVARANAEALHAKGHLTGLIELDRGSWAAVPASSQHSPAVRYESREAGMRVRIAAAAAATSTTASRPAVGAVQPTAQPRLQPQQANHGHGRNR
ncbi:zeta toxin family protein [Streptomyces sp. NPDC000405]|uniref:zeta toxin family protein n=1 Tax=Streptomyces sp. NPDC000405 TaxID=3161033 RepID=UPI00398CDD30